MFSWQKKKQVSLFFPEDRNNFGRYFDVSYAMGDLFQCTVCEWANGAHGAIADFQDIDDSWSEEFPDFPVYDILRFVDRESSILNDMGIELTEEQVKVFPIVASGIVAYWIKQFNCGNRNYPKIFNSYYEKMLRSYINIQESARPDTWEGEEKLKNEFDNGVHLKGELERIETSQAILPYLLESDRKRILALTENYINFIKSKATGPDEHWPYESESNEVETDEDIEEDMNVKDWNLFKDWILKDKVIDAIKSIPHKYVVGEVKRHFVIHKVLNEIGWLRYKVSTRYVGLMKYREVVDFKAKSFQDDDLEPFKKNPTLQWGSHLTPDSNLGENYRLFANIVRNTFTRIINGKLDDLKKYYEPGKIKYNQVIADNSES